MVWRRSGGKINFCLLCPDVTSRGAKAPILQPTTTMSDGRETNEPAVSRKDLPKASKDEKNITRKVEDPPLSGVEFDTFIHALCFMAFIAAAYYAFQTFKLS